MNGPKIAIVLFIVFSAFAVIHNFGGAQPFTQDEISKEEIVIIATNAVKVKESDLSEVKIIYDDGNKLWSEQIDKCPQPEDCPFFAILVNGFMRSYRAVYFDFNQPKPDIWVFVDKDTGEILEIFSRQ